MVSLIDVERLSQKFKVVKKLGYQRQFKDIFDALKNAFVCFSENY
ncbi:hypothetical protein [Candidatus Chrysopegis kryptomonas]|uniref:Uncharacterized protein n=1 Tax=Candidatus Chryseopegocella kryptomonas TaxID=1633643 RepID=A0A0N7MYF7_9BACT|nr:hypothetical protein [Candidatus Chrysopegis kryptomonas]CUT04115.1 hypothetical protein JGI23_01642 [Candidatus Chrysopegis kryptomonas]